MGERKKHWIHSEFRLLHNKVEGYKRFLKALALCVLYPNTGLIVQPVTYALSQQLHNVDLTLWNNSLREFLPSTLLRVIVLHTVKHNFNLRSPRVGLLLLNLICADSQKLPSQKKIAVRGKYNCSMSQILRWKCQYCFTAVILQLQCCIPAVQLQLLRPKYQSTALLLLFQN